MNNSPIIVIGTGRSGTSIVAGVLHHIGVNMGNNIVKPNIDNPRGYFEDVEFIDINSRFVHKNISEKEFIDRAEDLINYRIKRNEWWGWKAATNSYVLSSYKNIVPNAKVIWANRNLKDTIDSYKKCRFMYDGLNGVESLNSYLVYIHNILEETYENSWLKLEFEDAFIDPQKYVEKIIDFIGIKPTKEQIDNAVNFIYIKKT